MAEYLKLTGEVKGRVLDEVTVDLDEVWEKVSDKAFAAELGERASSEDVKHAITLYAPDDLWEDEESDPLFADWGDWDRRELLNAVKADDARRALDLLKRRA